MSDAGMFVSVCYVARRAQGYVWETADSSHTMFSTIALVENSPTLIHIKHLTIKRKMTMEKQKQMHAAHFFVVNIKMTGVSIIMKEANESMTKEAKK